MNIFLDTNNLPNMTFGILGQASTIICRQLFFLWRAAPALLLGWSWDTWFPHNWSCPWQAGYYLIWYYYLLTTCWVIKLNMLSDSMSLNENGIYMIEPKQVQRAQYTRWRSCPNAHGSYSYCIAFRLLACTWPLTIWSADRGEEDWGLVCR